MGPSSAVTAEVVIGKGSSPGRSPTMDEPTAHRRSRRPTCSASSGVWGGGPGRDHRHFRAQGILAYRPGSSSFKGRVTASSIGAESDGRETGRGIAPPLKKDYNNGTERTKASMVRVDGQLLPSNSHLIAPSPGDVFSPFPIS